MRMPNFPYHLARLEGKLLRRFYRTQLPWIVRRKMRVYRDVPLDVFAYSGQSALPEQAASIRSFLANVGRPKSFTIFSDSSYNSHSIRLLQRIDPVVHVSERLPDLPAEIPEQLRPYLSQHPTGKQLRLIMSLPVDGPARYTDSDVLFFPAAVDLVERLKSNGAPAYYLADYQFSGDERLLRDQSEKREPVNTGFLLLMRKLDWSLGLERLQGLNGPPVFFTNQTVVHLCMHSNGAQAFDPRKYVLRADDEFVYRDYYANGSLAMRHYVHQIRHKFWMNFSLQMRT
jgi:hypothetical protein